MTVLKTTVSKSGDEKLLQLNQIKQAADFPGFAPEDFEVFEAPEFGDRMPLLKQRITPKLKQLAAALTSRMADTTGETVFPHVALHLRRSVNPPVETWAAFARAARAYKPFVHYRVGISLDKVRVMVFVEDYAEDKLLFAKNLGRNAAGLAAWCLHHPTIHGYDILGKDDQPCAGRTLNSRALRPFAARLQQVKGQHARFGIAFANSHPVVSNGPELLDAVIEAVRLLKPFYDCGRPGFVYKYTPDTITGL